MMDVPLVKKVTIFPEVPYFGNQKPLQQVLLSFVAAHNLHLWKLEALLLSLEAVFNLHFWSMEARYYSRL